MSENNLSPMDELLKKIKSFTAEFANKMIDDARGQALPGPPVQLDEIKKLAQRVNNVLSQAIEGAPNLSRYDVLRGHLDNLLPPLISKCSRYVGVGQEEIRQHAMNLNRARLAIHRRPVKVSWRDRRDPTFNIYAEANKSVYTMLHPTVDDLIITLEGL